MTRNLFLGRRPQPRLPGAGRDGRPGRAPGGRGGDLQPGRAARPRPAHRLRHPRRRPRRRDRGGGAGPDRAPGGGRSGARARRWRPTISRCSRPSSRAAGCATGASPSRRTASVALPSAAGILVGLADREAMLAREELERLERADRQLRQRARRCETAHGTFSLARGWIAADVGRRPLRHHPPRGREPGGGRRRPARAGAGAGRGARRSASCRWCCSATSTPARSADVRLPARGRLRRRVDCRPTRTGPRAHLLPRPTARRPRGHAARAHRPDPHARPRRDRARSWSASSLTACGRPTIRGWWRSLSLPVPNSAGPIAPPHALDNVGTCVSPSSLRIRGRTPGA